MRRGSQRGMQESGGDRPTTEILTVQELAERFKVSETAVRRAITAGRLRAAKIGRHGGNGGMWRIALEDARACFDGSAQPSLKALYREFRAAKSALLAAERAEPRADRAN
jgi:excisionase family DNA binding protein